MSTKVNSINLQHRIGNQNNPVKRKTTKLMKFKAQPNVNKCNCINFLNLKKTKIKPS